MKANIFFMITTIFWGLNYHWGAAMVDEASSFEGAFWRYLVAVLVLVIATSKHLPTMNTIKQNWKGILLLGAFALPMFNFFFFKGMRETTPVNAALIVGLNPAITLILSTVILGTKICIKKVFGVLIALLGVLYLLFEGNIEALLTLEFKSGDAMIMIASMFFALHHVWVKKYSNPSITNSQLTFLVGFICLIFFALMLGGQMIWTKDLSLFTKVSSYSPRFWINTISMGVLGTGIAYWFWYSGIQLAGAAKAAVFVNIVPLSAAMAYVVLGSVLEPYHVISGVIILGGILIMEIDFSPRVANAICFSRDISQAS